MKAIYLICIIVALAYAQRVDQECDLGTFWSGQTCLPCANQCRCSSLGGCDSVECPLATVTIKNNGSGQCISCPDGCTQCQLSGNGGFTCQACMTNYTLIQKICIQDTFTTGFSASEVNGQGRWEVLQPRQVNNQTYPMTTTNVQCQALDSDTGLCNDCGSAAFFNENYECEKCVTGCATCTSRGTCNQCSDGFYWVVENTDISANGWGAGVCSACPGDGVLTCSNNGGPLTCMIGYFLESTSSTRKCSPCSQNCASCKSQMTCDVCQTGAYMDSGNCLECPGNSASILTCQSCDSSKSAKCDTCVTGYMRVGSTCQQCNSTISGCLECSTIGSSQLTCNVCAMGYYMVAGDGTTPSTCQPCISVNPNYLYCYKDDKGSKQVNISVTQCNTNFAYPGSETNYMLVPMASQTSVSTCVANTNNCMNMQNDSGNCTACFPGYILMGTTCQACPQFCTNCIVSNNVPACQTCQSGYFLSGGQCTQCPTGCTACTSSTNCTTCDLGYMMSSNVCQACLVDGCMTCSTNASKCDTCRPQFFLYTDSTNTQQCLVCPPGCKDCQGSLGQKCTTCLEGYYQYNDGCYQGSYACAIYNKDGTCDTCQYGLRAMNGRCFPCVSKVSGYVCGENAGSYSYLTQFVATVILTLFLQF